jgi:hypothetical protein
MDGLELRQGLGDAVAYGGAKPLLRSLMKSLWPDGNSLPQKSGLFDGGAILSAFRPVYEYEQRAVLNSGHFSNELRRFRK